MARSPPFRGLPVGQTPPPSRGHLLALREICRRLRTNRLHSAWIECAEIKPIKAAPGCELFSDPDVPNVRVAFRFRAMSQTLIYLARPGMRHLPRLTAWASPRASIAGIASNARGDAHAVKRLTFGRVRYNTTSSPGRKPAEKVREAALDRTRLLLFRPALSACRLLLAHHLPATSGPRRLRWRTGRDLRRCGGRVAGEASRG